MSAVRRNVVANLLGKASTALFGLVFVPFYINLLGAEAYGLIGLYASVQSLVLLADIGLTGAFTREVARLGASNPRRLADLGRTFEIFFLSLGGVVVVVLSVLSRWRGPAWLNAHDISNSVLRESLLLASVAVGLQFPFAIYQGGLLGLQKQGVLNLIIACAGLARGVGGVLLLVFWSRTVECFFGWQVCVGAIQVALMRCAYWRQIGVGHWPWRFNGTLFVSLWRFARDMAFIGITSAILMQMDKVVLSRLLPLAAVGYYSIASVVGGVPLLLSTPFYNAVYPRFTQLVGQGATSELRSLYERTSQALSVVLLPLGVTVACFSKPILLIWTGSHDVADQASLLASLLIAGSTLLGMMAIPYALQLAYAWTRLPLLVNIVALIVLIPLLVILTERYGATGAAIVWLVLNIGYVGFTIQLMHRRILRGAQWTWYREALLKPLMTVCAIVLISRHYASDTFSALEYVIWIGGTLVVATVGTAVALPAMRQLGASVLFAGRGRYE